jgi:hypothetical protein
LKGKANLLLLSFFFFFFLFFFLDGLGAQAHSCSELMNSEIMILPDIWHDSMSG